MVVVNHRYDYGQISLRNKINKIEIMNKDQLVEWEKLDSREKRLLQYVADYHLFKRILL